MSNLLKVVCSLCRATAELHELEGWIARHRCPGGIYCRVFVVFREGAQQP